MVDRIEGRGALTDDPSPSGTRGAGRRLRFAAVNLISDPIHGYIQLTKRLTRAESAEAGLPDESVAEEDLLDIVGRDTEISQIGNLCAGKEDVAGHKDGMAELLEPERRRRIAGRQAERNPSDLRERSDNAGT